MKKLLIICTVLLVLPCPVFAGTLPDTGQTTSYDTGDDGYYAPCNPHSYTNLSAGTMVQDNVTGLIWEVKNSKDDIKDYNNPHDADNTYTWYDSNPATNGGNPGTPGGGTDTEDFINALNTAQFGGHNDWRLPTIKELSTLVDSSIPNPGPTINTDYFPNTVSSYYWSSTTSAGGSYYAWNVYFGYGRVVSYRKSNYVYGRAFYYVRAVRGGQCGLCDDLFNFEDNEDGTVTDTETGLMWQKDTAPGTYNWQSALSYCESLTLADYDDWRLPNRNELQSLVDYSQYDPSIDTTFFPNTVSFLAAYWSSTTYAINPDGAWPVGFRIGIVDCRDKSMGHYVRAVRGGQCGLFGDSDSDGILDDGDSSGTPGDNPCTSGQTENCDDNCPTIYNPGQADSDNDGIGDACSQLIVADVPTLSEWGLIIFMTIILGISVVMMYKRGQT